jgi:hypothetical protein
VYGPTPPEGVTVAVPFGLPQVEGVVVVDAATGVGCVIVYVRVMVQPFASVTVTVYVPAARPVAEEPVPPLGAHEYVYGAVPPEATTVAEPVVPPLQSTFTCEPVVASAGGCVMLNVLVVVQPFASVTVTV